MSNTSSILTTANRSHATFFGRIQELNKLHALCDRFLQLNDNDGGNTQVKKGERGSQRNDSKNKKSPRKDASPQVSNSTSNSTSNSSSKTLLPVALVWGVSGSGKSRLLQHFCDQLVDGKPTKKNDDDQARPPTAPLCESSSSPAVYILKGKCDEFSGASDPFSVIVQALRDFAMQLKQGPDHELDRIRSRVKDLLGDETIAFLVSMVPALAILKPGSGASVASVPYSQQYQTASASSASGSGSGSNSQSDAASVALSNHGIYMDSSASSTEVAWNRLQYAFTKFVAAISTQERPVLMCLDDLQWASMISLDLLTSVVSDTSTSNFVLFGTIRQETNPHNDEILEVSDHTPLSQFLRQFSDDPERDLAEQITLSNMSESQTDEWMAATLHRSLEDVQPLAAQLYIKTSGNMFHLLQALEELERNHVLVYDETKSHWEWQWNEGDALPLSGTALTAIVTKVKQLPGELQSMLMVAAYIKSSFDLNILKMVMDAETDHPSGLCEAKLSYTMMAPLLERAVLEGLLINAIGGTTYSFTHDRVQQAMHGLVKFGEDRNSLRQRIGALLLGKWRQRNGARRLSITMYPPAALSSITKPSVPTTAGGVERNSGTTHDDDAGGIDSNEDVLIDDSLLFVAADHLNSVKNKDHLFIANMNLEVGERASQIAALQSASTYLEKASTALNLTRQPWQNQYIFCLRLTALRADIELSAGNFEIGEKLGQEVMDNATQLDHKLPTYLSIAKSLGRQSRHREGLDLSRSAVQQLGEFPKRGYLRHVIMDTMSVKRFLRRHGDADILALPAKTDARKIFAMKLIHEVSFRSFHTKEMLQYMVALCKLLRISFRHGLCAYSAVGIGVFSLVVSAMGDQQLANRCSKLSLDIMKKLQTNEQLPLVHLLGGIHMAYSHRHIEQVAFYNRARIIAMETGDLEMGFTLWTTSVVTPIISGFDLRKVLVDLEHLTQQAKLYKVDAASATTVEFLYALKVLTGVIPVDWDEISRAATQTIDEGDEQFSYQRNAFYCARAFIAIHFGKYEWAEPMATKYKEGTSHDNTYLSETFGSMPQGVSAAGLYRQNGKKKHLRQLKQNIVEFSKRTKTKGLNALHRKLMLKAEAASLQGKNHQKVRKAYDLAILMASNSGFVNDAALASELAGEHFLRINQHSYIGDYFTQAVKFYQQWGCMAKVKDLEERRLIFIDTAKTQSIRQRSFGVVDVTLSGPSVAGTGYMIDAAGQSVQGRTKLTTTDGEDDISVLSDE